MDPAGRVAQAERLLSAGQWRLSQKVVWAECNQLQSFDSVGLRYAQPYIMAFTTALVFFLVRRPVDDFFVDSLVQEADQFSGGVFTEVQVVRFAQRRIDADA